MEKEEKLLEILAKAKEAALQIDRMEGVNKSGEEQRFEVIDIVGKVSTACDELGESVNSLVKSLRSTQ